ncbi:hypothetical protein FJV83_31400 [Mesorhizobium sp. WSM4307]|uniref:hypothetical protein n=1 Tax=unclassified Mesorhizobium TaxID=325217 RepID=UPI00115DB583|nr:MULTISPECIES: hypothetical protein [unclassified Mesorhizobium]TRC72032.1 hypothetical protein FJV81_30360 [Mesorhizobium sp. WSM4315]TRC77808.1 hypothetical protein FJV83_31400 [Mesorhizobium sp. WSM4307]
MTAASSDMALAYAKNYWDAGNQVVILMFGLAFAVYYTLTQYKEVLRLVSKYNFRLIRLTLISNLLLLALLWILNTQETAVAQIVTPEDALLRAIAAGFYIRASLLIGNTVLYIIVLRFVKNRIDPNTGNPISPPQQ